MHGAALDEGGHEQYHAEHDQRARPPVGLQGMARKKQNIKLVENIFKNKIKLNKKSIRQQEMEMSNAFYV